MTVASSFLELEISDGLKSCLLKLLADALRRCFVTATGPSNTPPELPDKKNYPTSPLYFPAG